MDSRAVTRVVGILLVYTVFFVLTTQLDPGWFSMQILGTSIKVRFGDALQGHAMDVVIVAFVCSLIWLAVGQWAIPAWAPGRTWYLTWTVLFLVIVAAAVYLWFDAAAIIKVLRISIGEDDSDHILATYLAVGILPFYICSVLFTSANRKYLFWPARHVVTW